MASRKITLSETVDFRKVLQVRREELKVPVDRVGPWQYSSYRPDDTKECHVCGDPTTKVCPMCLLTPYCTQMCLARDETAHIKLCQGELPYMLNVDENGTFSYFVTGKITPGTQIFKYDIPVILPTLPVKLYQKNEERSIKSRPFQNICFHCHTHFYPPDDPTYCSRCGIPKCSSDCRGDYHNDIECDVLKESYDGNLSDFTSNTRKYIDFYLDICTLRVLSSFSGGETNLFVADRYRKFILLTTNIRFHMFDSTKKDPYDGVPYLDVIDPFESVEPLQMSLAYVGCDEYVVEEVYKLMAVFWEKYDLRPGQPSRLLFIDRNFMTPSYCSPNTVSKIIFDPVNRKPNFVTYMIEEVDGTNGDLKLLSFDGSPSPFMAMPLRMEFYKEYLLVNYCIRHGDSLKLCDDPADGGTNSGGTNCMKCAKGLYADLEVRDNDPFCCVPVCWSLDYINQMWKCNECGDSQPYSVILKENRKFEKLYMDMYNNEFGCCRLYDIKKFVEACEKHLHPLHGVILGAKYHFVMAAREKNLHESGFTSTRLLGDINHLSQLALGLAPKNSAKIRLFPSKWNKNEVTLTRLKSKFAGDCLDYLENVQRHRQSKSSITNDTDISILRVERALMDLVISCHDFLKDPNCGKKCIDVGQECAKEIREFSVKWETVFKPIFSHTDPLVKWQAETKSFGDLIEQLSDPKDVAELILNNMRLSKEQFTSV